MIEDQVYVLVVGFEHVDGVELQHVLDQVRIFRDKLLAVQLVDRLFPLPQRLRFLPLLNRGNVILIKRRQQHLPGPDPLLVTSLQLPVYFCQQGGAGVVLPLDHPDPQLVL